MVKHQVVSYSKTVSEILKLIAWLYGDRSPKAMSHRKQNLFSKPAVSFPLASLPPKKTKHACDTVFSLVFCGTFYDMQKNSNVFMWKKDPIWKVRLPFFFFSCQGDTVMRKVAEVFTYRIIVREFVHQIFLRYSDDRIKDRWIYSQLGLNGFSSNKFVSWASEMQFSMIWVSVTSGLHTSSTKRL